MWGENFLSGGTLRGKFLREMRSRFPGMIWKRPEIKFKNWVFSTESKEKILIAFWSWSVVIYRNKRFNCYFLDTYVICCVLVKSLPSPSILNTLYSLGPLSLRKRFWICLCVLAMVGSSSFPPLSAFYSGPTFLFTL